MRNYELTLIIDPELSTEDQKKLITKIKKLVTDLKGKIGKVNEWGKKEFNYPIKKKNMGYYFCLEIGLPVKAVTDLDKKLRLEEAIYRFLLVSLSNKK